MNSMNSMAQDGFNASLSNSEITETTQMISMSQSREASVFEDSCVCINNEELQQKLVEIQQMAGMLQTKNKILMKSVHDGKKMNHCTIYQVLTWKNAEFENAFDVLQTKIDDVSARVLNLQKSCNCSTCDEVSERVVGFDNQVKKLRMDNRNLLNLYTQQEYSNCTTLESLAENGKQTEMLEMIEENLLVRMQSLQEREESLRHKDERETFMKCELEAMNEHKKREIYRLRAEVCTLKDKLDDAEEVIKVGVQRTRELTCVKSLMEKKKAEVNKLTNILQKRNEQEKLLKQQNIILMDDLAKRKSQRDKQYKENKMLKTSQQNVLCQLQEADLLILKKDELITKQSREIADYEKTIEEQHLLTDDLRKTVCDLKDQVEESQLNLIKEQTRDNHLNLQEELKISIQQEEEKTKPNFLWFLKWFLFIVTLVVSFFIFESFLTNGLVYSCNVNCEFVQPFYNFHPKPF